MVREYGMHIALQTKYKQRAIRNTKSYPTLERAIVSVPKASGREAGIYVKNIRLDPLATVTRHIIRQSESSGTGVKRSVTAHCIEMTFRHKEANTNKGGQNKAPNVRGGGKAQAANQSAVWL